MQGLLVLGVVGFVAQLIDGSLGMAYGATSSTLVLAAGVAPAAASASVHLAELGTTVAAGVSHARFGNVDWRTVRRIGIPGGAGAFLGAVVLSSVSGDLAAPWMAAILLAIASTSSSVSPSPALRDRAGARTSASATSRPSASAPGSSTRPEAAAGARWRRRRSSPRGSWSRGR